ncbi:DUF389 domain-containing protein [Nocardioides mangrovi]|uniref:DUF389 domain-containing protein n=1 Tax=Nocardioides mangrovi TaxID=2874580 RepID=A0ABS7UAF0_9ACTN|nr:DUF389 domain-containing protein [Nocardioides mangrovi]MBZ5737966.1 DUF389 domain-containing protein [Nocardioides mangrovi]
MQAPRWARATPIDVTRITERLYLTRGDRVRNLSAFAVLLVLAAVIASAGVVSDSTATVIGAMIVAPLMTPILGTATAIVLADRRQILHGIALTAGGGAAVVVIGYALGLLTQGDVVAATNSQVAGRVSPGLIDLLAALATGGVGAFALVRSDVSDTLPGVAIAISLVPPLAVVGLTAESGAYDESLGALLLFGTNVAAIICTGVVVLLWSDLRDAAVAAGEPVGALGRRTLAVLAASMVVLVVPLALGTWQVVQEQLVIAAARPVADDWAHDQGWEVTDIELRQGTLHITAVGRTFKADDAALRAALDDAGLADLPAEVTLVAGGSRSVPVS